MKATKHDGNGIPTYFAVFLGLRFSLFFGLLSPMAYLQLCDSCVASLASRPCDRLRPAIIRAVRPARLARFPRLRAPPTFVGTVAVPRAPAPARRRRGSWDRDGTGSAGPPPPPAPHARPSPGCC